jgi:O-antigen/teichoic acid export membrane protein
VRQSYFKNAALLTGSDVVLRLAGMGLRIWLANALGGAGMGLYQLVLAVYGLFVTLATAGISVAAARLLTEELSRDKAAARGMLVRLVLAGLTLGGLAMAAQLATAGLAAKWWLGDVRAAADVQALQITGRHAVADEMKFERFHGKTPLSGKEFLFAVKFCTGSGHPARAVRHKICVDYL